MQKIRHIQFALVVLLLFLIGITNLPAQRYFTKTYTEADGLLSSMVFDVAQDTSGVLWFATRLGVSSYDGINWTNYNPSSIKMSLSFAIVMVDERGKPWAAPLRSDLSVYWFSGKNWHLFDCKSPEIHPVSISSLDVFYQDDMPVLVVGTYNDGVFVSHNKQWMHYSEKEGLISNITKGVAIIGDKIVIGTMKGLSVLSDGIVSNEINSILPPSSLEILALTKGRNLEDTTSDPKIYLLGDGWLGSLSDSTFSMITQRFRLPPFKRSSNSFIYPDDKGGIFFGNPYNFYYHSLFSAGSPELMTKDMGLISPGATSVFIDREKNTWITGLRGITKIPSKRFSSFSTADGLLDNEVTSALEYAPGSYIFGHNGSVSFFDGKRFETMNLDPSSENLDYEIRVQDIDQDQHGNIWLAVSHLGIARIDKQKRVKWYREPLGISGNMVSVVVTPNETIYAASNDKVFKLTGERFVQLPISNIQNSGIRKLFIEDDTTLYIATISSGLLEIKGNKDTRYLTLGDEHGNSVFSFLIDSQNRKWVGTTDGLYFISEGKLIKHTSNKLNINRPVYLILEDHQGGLWFGTDNGAYRWNGEKLDHFTINDGFSGLEVNRDAGFEDHNNHIWFGTNNGITKFNPEYDYDLNTIPPPIIRLQFIETDNDTLNPSENLVLSSRMNNLFFHFVITSYIDEHQVVYQCKLDGLDNTWSQEVFSQNNVFRYNNLAPGTYRFCVKARNSIGIWSDPVCSGTIRIQQPFWFQWWFILAAVLFISSLLFILTRLFVIKRYNLSLSKMVAIRTRELQRSEKDLKESNEAKDNFFSIIAHDLKSPFNAILGMLELLTTEYEEFTDKERHKILMSLRTASTRTIDLLENLLTWAQAQKGLLPFVPEKFDLMELVRENISLFEPTASTKRIRVSAPLSENVIVYGDRNMINTVIRNLISNAIKFTYPDGDVTIEVENDSDQKVTFAVIDNGCGMNKSALENLFILDKRVTTKGTGNETGTGLGLVLSKDFIKKNRGKIWVESKLESGTTFFFTLPINPPE